MGDGCLVHLLDFHAGPRLVGVGVGGGSFVVDLAVAFGCDDG